MDFTPKEQSTEEDEGKMTLKRLSELQRLTAFVSDAVNLDHESLSDIPDDLMSAWKGYVESKARLNSVLDRYNIDHV